MLYWLARMSTDDDELGYIWMKVKFTQKYLKNNPGKTPEDAEKEFLEWIDGLGMDSRIERNNRFMRSKQ
jgi:hypothetical protein